MGGLLCCSRRGVSEGDQGADATRGNYFSGLVCLAELASLRSECAQCSTVQAGEEKERVEVDCLLGGGARREWKAQDRQGAGSAERMQREWGGRVAGSEMMI